MLFQKSDSPLLWKENQKRMLEFKTCGFEKVYSVKSRSSAKLTEQKMIKAERARLGASLSFLAPFVPLDLEPSSGAETRED